MADFLSKISIRPLGKQEEVPYKLLLLADPNQEVIDAYLKNSSIYIAVLADETVGVFVLFPLSDERVEIKNIAVAEPHQDKGIGKILLSEAIRIAQQHHYQSIWIGTANSSIAQLYLYQKMGFEIMEIKKDFFLQNYPDPIFENGIQAKHLLLLSQALSYH